MEMPRRARGWAGVQVFALGHSTRVEPHRLTAFAQVRRRQVLYPAA